MVCQRIIADGVREGPAPLVMKQVVTACSWCAESVKSAAKARNSKASEVCHLSLAAIAAQSPREGKDKRLK
jgi:hypothetical protein